MIKKSLLCAAAALMVAVSGSAQLKVFNHLGADLSVGTTGVSVNLSTTITDYLQMRAGVAIMPGFNFKLSEMSVETPIPDDVPAAVAATIPEEINVDLSLGLGRTQGEVIFNVYPFGARNSFFVAAGAYFGGNSLINLKAHSDEVRDIMQNDKLQSYVEIGDYQIDFDKNGDLKGGILTNGFRPYVGLGYGRPCPKKRVGFMIELGAQFMGKCKIAQGDPLKPIDINEVLGDNDNAQMIQTIMDKVTVYPVLKFTLTGRIL